MTKKEAYKIKKGDWIITKGYYAFEVKDISYVEPCNIPHSGIYFHDDKGQSYFHKDCKLYKQKGE